MIRIYEVLPCPTVDHWGLLLRRDNPLSQKEKIIRVQDDDDTLCFRLLDPPIFDKLLIAWKRFQLFSKGTQQFIQLLKQEKASLDAMTPPRP